MNDTNENTQALLSQLRDIQTPEVSAWPAAGWWLLLCVLLLLLSLAFFWQRRHARRVWMRQARAELLHIRQHISEAPSAQSLASLSQLTRRVVLARSPRTQVASVQGDAWLHLLDELYGEPVFTQGYGRLLASGPYRRNQSCSEEELNGLADTVEQLISASARQAVVLPDRPARRRITP